MPYLMAPLDGSETSGISPQGGGDSKIKNLKLYSCEGHEAERQILSGLETNASHLKSLVCDQLASSLPLSLENLLLISSARV